MIIDIMWLCGSLCPEELALLTCFSDCWFGSVMLHVKVDSAYAIVTVNYERN